MCLVAFLKNNLVEHDLITIFENKNNHRFHLVFFFSTKNCREFKVIFLVFSEKHTVCKKKISKIVGHASIFENKQPHHFHIMFFFTKNSFREFKIVHQTSFSCVFWRMETENKKQKKGENCTHISYEYKEFKRFLIRENPNKYEGN